MSKQFVYNITYGHHSLSYGHIHRLETSIQCINHKNNHWWWKNYKLDIFKFVVTIRSCTTLQSNMMWNCISSQCTFLNEWVQGFEFVIATPNKKYFVWKSLQVWVCIQGLPKLLILSFIIFILVLHNLQGDIHFLPKIVCLGNVKNTLPPFL